MVKAKTVVKHPKTKMIHPVQGKMNMDVDIHAVNN